MAHSRCPRNRPRGLCWRGWGDSVPGAMHMLAPGTRPALAGWRGTWLPRGACDRRTGSPSPRHTHPEQLLCAAGTGGHRLPPGTGPGWSVPGLAGEAQTGRGWEAPQTVGPRPGGPEGLRGCGKRVRKRNSQVNAPKPSARGGGPRGSGPWGCGFHLLPTDGPRSPSPHPAAPPGGLPAPRPLIVAPAAGPLPGAACGHRPLSARHSGCLCG